MSFMKTGPFCLLLVLLVPICTSTDTVTPARPVKYSDVLVSNGGTFALGFFSPNDSSNIYLGIWYNKVSEQTVVWVANRDNPVTNSSAVALSIDQTGNLVLHDEDRGISVWSSHVFTTRRTGNYTGQLLDSGNLVLLHGETKQLVAWQSFDYPTNTLLPNMKLGLDRRTRLNRFLTSWKSTADPGTGEYSYKMEFVGSPQLFLYKGLSRIWRTGTWTGHGWSGVPEMTPNFIFNGTYVDDNDEVIMEYSIQNTSIFSRLVVNESGSVERSTWHDADRKWVTFWSAPKDQCDYYSHCGPFGDCDPSDPGRFECKCLPGFEPNSSRDWYLRDGSGGCVKKRGALRCGNREGFVKLTNVKIPDSSTGRVDMSVGLEACGDLCLHNCSCTGYANAEISGGGRGCITWYEDMIDIRQFSNGGQDLYIRVDAAELAQYSRKSKSIHPNEIIGIVVSSAATAVFLIFCFKCWYTRKKRAKRKRYAELFMFSASPTSLQGSGTGNEINESGSKADLRLFDLSTIVSATDSFSSANKLGEGGFGSVYKGRLHNGQEIAVKRLSNSSGQGIDEFKNEVMLIAKLQHRNLVKLWGCCIQKEEKMLIYEYMPNKGLDSFIFDKEKASILDWRKRFEIILGIVRGLLYLHQDSRLRIIHRDLKASNVLLDAALNPKISDFGMAKIFGGDQTEAKTLRVVGTYGYMSPEYAMEGLFSIKSDVFSFGVLVLEIISGRKNSSYYLQNSVNLIGHVWQLWRQGEGLSVVDSSLGELYEVGEIERCIHVGLLCLQESANDRPTMSEVAFMLCNETALPCPKQPAFIFRKLYGTESGSASVGAISVYEETITVIEAR